MAGGRPPHFENAEELKKEVDNYFESIDGIEHPTVTGLALFLGFESRQSVYDYEKNGEFSYIIKRARLMVENGYEKDLRSEKPTGAIFALKNMGWTDKQEIDHTTKGQALNGKDLTKLTDDELRTMSAIEKKLNA